LAVRAISLQDKVKEKPTPNLNTVAGISESQALAFCCLSETHMVLLGWQPQYNPDGKTLVGELELGSVFPSHSSHLNVPPGVSSLGEQALSKLFSKADFNRLKISGHLNCGHKDHESFL
jgi:hypothetical protein